MSNYADEKTFFVVNKNINEFINDLSNNFRILTKWFHETYKSLNIDVCYFMTLSIQAQIFGFFHKNVVSKISIGEKILEIAKRNQLNFPYGVKNIYIVANQKVSALCIISNYIDSDRCKLSRLLPLCLLHILYSTIQS